MPVAGPLLTAAQSARPDSYLGSDPARTVESLIAGYGMSRHAAGRPVDEVADEVRAAIAAASDETSARRCRPPAACGSAGVLARGDALLAFIVGAFGLPVELASRIADLVVFTDGAAADWVTA